MRPPLSLDGHAHARMPYPPDNQVEGDLVSRLLIREERGRRTDLDRVAVHALDRARATGKRRNEIVEEVGFGDPDAHCRRWRWKPWRPPVGELISLSPFTLCQSGRC
jgi:hypothetical protein